MTHWARRPTGCGTVRRTGKVASSLRAEHRPGGGMQEARSPGGPECRREGCRFLAWTRSVWQPSQDRKEALGLQAGERMHGGADHQSTGVEAGVRGRGACEGPSTWKGGRQTRRQRCPACLTGRSKGGNEDGRAGTGSSTWEFEHEARRPVGADGCRLGARTPEAPGSCCHCSHWLMVSPRLAKGLGFLCGYALGLCRRLH